MLFKTATSSQSRSDERCVSDALHLLDVLALHLREKAEKGPMSSWT